MRRSTTALLASLLLAACTTPRLLPFDAGDDMDASDGALDAPPDAWMCVEATSACASESECCGDLACATTATSGPERTVCCGLATEPCSFIDGEDCCGRLICATTTTSGTRKVCCAESGQACTTSTGCCGTSVCRSGVCS
ncbi:hypothetical protein [Sandaracinus amylolyticus]|uniref:Tryptophan synthase alpha chain n=1 Tax=Sandaracinus amylolyticus TaxID=927083 RepID=A0A0F6W9I9_9BACT|nr:hypothetical protein [Sandaracinus amylolyticus]AKF10848.1 hypothetical protein DB32_007997 [Sandaracinus amylolyticus]